MTPGSVSRVTDARSSAATSNCARPKSTIFTPLAGQDDVLRLEVAMHDAALVRGLQRGGNRPRDVERPRLAERSRAELLAQCPALEIFGGDEDLIADFFERKHGGDRRMGERGGGARFLAQARAHPIVPEQVRGQCLQRDRALQPRVACEVDDSHAATPDNPLDPIRSDLDPFGQQRRRLEKSEAVVV